MKPLRRRLEETRKNTGVPWEMIERDYLLSWILAGIDASEKVRSVLVFKRRSVLKEPCSDGYGFS